MEYLGDTLIQLNKPAEARPWLEKTVKLDPRRFGTRFSSLKNTKTVGW